ncbi:MAG: ATP-binding protein [Eubacterium sp.]|nr:ATP-binding protein [Eubacterium sp.]
MKRFIDRVNEFQTLTNEYNRKGSSFVVIYGRRRLGKTTLINEFCKDKRCINFLATEEEESNNIRSFKDVVAEELGNKLLKEANINNWNTIFELIADSTKEEEKLIIVIDEFQYLGKSNPAFPSILQKIWDDTLSKKNIMFIICGSLIRMMQSQVLDYSSPLYGRRTAQIKMRQIPFAYYKDFYDGISQEDLILRYSVTGGVPKYIELFEGEGSIEELIRQNILNTGSFLYEEPEFLLRNEINEVGRYFTILKTIALGKRKLGDISAAVELPQTQISSYLKTLIDLDILTRDVPVTEDNPEKSKSGLYRICDNYIYFWFRFIYPYRANIERGDTEWVLEKINLSLKSNHASFVYEDVCREDAYQRFKEEMGITRIGKWWHKKEGEIEIVALGENKEVLFGECKYSVNPKGMGDLDKLLRQSEKVVWNNADRRSRYIIYSHSGFDEALTEYAEHRDDIFLIQL